MFWGNLTSHFSYNFWIVSRSQPSLKEEEKYDTLRDHRLVLTEMHKSATQQSSPAVKGWIHKGINEDNFDREIYRVADYWWPQGDIRNGDSAEVAAQGLVLDIFDACDNSMPRKKTIPGRKQNHWWTQELAVLRSANIVARRRLTRARGRSRPTAELETAYKKSKKALKIAIKKAKHRSWQDKMLHITRQLFPQRLQTSVRVQREKAENPQVFDMWELAIAVSKLSSEKAPGPDGVPNEMLRRVALLEPGWLFAIFNSTIREEGIFPIFWKTRLLCLIDKGLQLEEAFWEAGGLSNRQFGFRTGRSVIDALGVLNTAVSRLYAQNIRRAGVCAMVTLDIHNAFNETDWALIMNRLEQNWRIPAYLFRIVEDYLRDKHLSTLSARMQWRVEKIIELHKLYKFFILKEIYYNSRKESRCFYLNS